MLDGLKRAERSGTLRISSSKRFASTVASLYRNDCNVNGKHLFGAPNKNLDCLVGPPWVSFQGGWSCLRSGDMITSALRIGRKTVLRVRVAINAAVVWLGTRCTVPPGKSLSAREYSPQSKGY